MGHILFGLPRIGAYHLHARLARKLAARGHRISILCADPVDHSFYAEQGWTCHGLPLRGGVGAEEAPFDALAELDLRLRRGGNLAARSAGLRRRFAGMAARFELDPPDLVLIHEGRDGLRRLLQFCARVAGVPVLHIGDGLLPATLQWDDEGLDGDSSLCRLTAQDYRGKPIDECFLDAATAAWLGRAVPPPLPRLHMRIPGQLKRLWAAMRCLGRGEARRALRAGTAWQDATGVAPVEPERPPSVPRKPYLAVLLQDPADPRLRLDAQLPPNHRQLIHSTQRAAQRLDPGLRVAVIAPGERIPATLQGIADPPELEVLPASSAAPAVATALCTITINHPLGMAAILSGTPLLHLGRSPYGIAGISRWASCATLSEDLRQALDADPGALRQRFLTHVLKERHIWCPGQRPDNNGVNGLVVAIEERLGGPGIRVRPLRYRPGPVWPLAPGKLRR